MADDYNGTPLPENQNPEPGNGDQNDNIPDWMKEAGWETSSGTFDESKPVFDDLDDEDEIVPADIPAWLEDAAPEGFSSDPNATPAFEGLDVDEPFITTGDLVPPPSMQSPPETSEPAETAVPAKPAIPAKPEGDAFDIPTWLENLELDEDSQETAVAWLENMPESLRATEEELEAARAIPTKEPEVVEDHEDELAWVDEISLEPEEPVAVDEEQAALSEDLVASDLIPETGEPEQIFQQDEIESVESDLPSWLKELGDDQTAPAVPDEELPRPAADTLETSTQIPDETIPDWLRSTEVTDISEAQVEEPAPPPSEGSADFPDWLSDFEESGKEAADDEDSLEWLDSIAAGEAAPEEAALPSFEDLIEETPQDEPSYPDLDLDETLPGEPTLRPEDFAEPEGVSPNDETLNAQVPDWLSKIDDAEEAEEEMDLVEGFERLEISEPSLTEEEFETPDSWLEQITETPPDATHDEIESLESEAVDWLDDMELLEEEPLAEELEEIQEETSDAASEEPPPVELETAKYFTDEEPVREEKPDDLPDWLSELREIDEEPVSLEEAIRQSDHDLNEAEVDFLNRIEEKQEEDADWLSKLDDVESQPDLEPSTPAIELEPFDVEEPVEELPQEPIAGGILDRLIQTGELKPGEEVPQWLADIKEEEDPQETAVLWLQQFVNQGDAVDIKDEIKRYTDELDPGDSIPKWMEDLKNEEDPQTTAMLWLEKLSGARQPQAAPEPPPSEDEDSGWLADLEREAAESAPSQEEQIKDFDAGDEGWLADLEIDQKLKSSEEELPEWSKTEGETPEGEPPWMKATSPLEGDFYTDELAGGEEKEVEIPEWLAGYGEGERPEEAEEQEELPEDEEYTWLSATDAPAVARTPLDLNKAAISQLEGILGISHQIAKGIVSYREKNGPFRDFSDLKDVPEITDEQTIDILKPEVFIGEVLPDEEPSTPAPAPAPAPAPKAEPAPPVRKPAKKPAKSENFEEMLVTARTRISGRAIKEATDIYASLIKKKKFLDEIVEDLQKASLDHPLEISIQKTLGDAFMQKDMLDEALEAYSKAEDLLS